MDSSSNCIVNVGLPSHCDGLGTKRKERRSGEQLDYEPFIPIYLQSKFYDKKLHKEDKHQAVCLIGIE